MEFARCIQALFPKMSMEISDPHAFDRRHIGPDAAEQAAMLDALGVESLDALIDETIPEPIRTREPLPLPEPISEHAVLDHLSAIGDQNVINKSYIGMGYHDCITPPPILRNIFESPAWYTPYTPYQAEIAQGRLESLMNFQTMVADLTGMDLANASLLDEATAAAEAMTLLHRVHRRRGKNAATAQRFLITDRCAPHVLAVLQTRAEPLDVEWIVVPPAEMAFDDSVFGALLYTPDDDGALHDWTALIEQAHQAGAKVAVGTDLMALTLIRPPGEMGADVVFGSAQRFGVPLGYGGPHAAFFAVRDALKREVPGRIVGVSQARDGRPAYRLALQTREQHIRREKATSNICTAQALLANMAAMYAVYHGPDGLKAIATRIHRRTVQLARGLDALGYGLLPSPYFDTLHVVTESASAIQAAGWQAGINLRCFGQQALGISLNETTSATDVAELLEFFAGQAGQPVPKLGEAAPSIPAELQRTSPYLTHPVFSQHRSETELMRYIKQLERKDLGLDTSMISLGSCTMKLNGAVQLMPVSWPAFSRLHPFVPLDQARGYQQICVELERDLAVITGLDHVSLQPNSGAQGEFAGLMAIRGWHRANGQAHRRVALIPTSAHGTNPASAIMSGMQVVLVSCKEDGRIDVDDLQRKLTTHKDTLAVLMITYPSTFGVFDEGVETICRWVHEHGGQVYMDGANLNAQVGLTSPGRIGADVCHLNLHKTFAIPHGGGGPGMGPIAVASHLAPYLPRNPLADAATSEQPAISAAPWGSASILLISYAYVRLLGASGVTEASRVAILNANYIQQRLSPYFPVQYRGRNGRVAHEVIFDCRPRKESAGITETDIAKRLMDYGFHAPTVSWPVPGTMMIEPTESESKAELDRFCDALISIHAEIRAIASGQANREDNVLINAPHTAAEACGDDWAHAYSRQQAVYPLPFVREHKFWPASARIDNAYGDRNLVCSCPPLSDYK